MAQTDLRTLRLALVCAAAAVTVALPGCGGSPNATAKPKAKESEKQRAERIAGRVRGHGHVESVNCRRWPDKPRAWDCTLDIAGGKHQQCGMTLPRGKHVYVACSSAKSGK